MRIRIFAVAAAAAVLTFGGAVVGSASTVTFDFDDANNGDQTYSKFGFTYQPINLNSANSCYTASVPSGNGSCFLEVTNGTPTNLTQDNGNSFDLLSFHFNFQGNAPNSLLLSDSEDPPSFTLALGTSYDGTGPVKIYDADTLSLFTGALVKQTGYFAVFDTHFDGVDLFRWDAVENKQVRVDCVTVSTDGSNISSSELGACSASSPAPVPLPATALLLIGGIGGLGALRAFRRRG